MPEATPTTPPPTTQLNITRHENFESWYANNIQYEPSEWDLRMVFGILDLPPGRPPSLEQHTAMSLSWRQVKLLSYFLQLHLGIHELTNGKITIPPGILPPEPIPPTAEMKAANMFAQEIYDLIRQQRKSSLQRIDRGILRNHAL